MTIITAALKATIATSTWQDQHLITAEGNPRWFGISAYNEWILGAPPSCPRSLDYPSFAILQRGTLTTDGRVALDGITYALVPRGEGPGSLVVCEPGGPPPT